MEEESTTAHEAQEQELAQDVGQDIVGQDISTEAPVEAAPQEETPQQGNFKRLRQQKELAEAELHQTRLRLQQYEQQKVQAEPEDDFDIGNDDLAEGKHLRKVNKRVKDLESQISRYEKSSVETRLHSKYNDFDSVVSQENISELAAQYPEIARTIDSSNDLYTKAVSAYTMIKKLGIAVEDTFGADRDLAQKNSAKPRPLTSVSPQQGSGPLQHANAFASGLTPELKKQLHAEMLEASSRR